MNTEQARRAVDAIVYDLAGRKGLGDEWDQIDDDIREEIIEKWTDIVAATAQQQDG